MTNRSQHSATTEVRPINICVLGEVGVGKSSLVLQFTQSFFPTDFDPYVEDTYSKDIIINDTPYKLNILDTANQDDYSPLKDVQLKEADGVMIVFNVNNNETFREVSNSYSHLMRTRSYLPPTLLIGNQMDLTNERQVSAHQAETLVQELGFTNYMETSARSNINVTESFTYLCERILKRKIFKKPSLAQIRVVSEQSDPNDLNVDVVEYEDNSPQLNKQKDVHPDASNKNKSFTIGANFEAISVGSKKSNELPTEGETREVPSPKNKRVTQTTPKTKEDSTGGCCVIV